MSSLERFEANPRGIAALLKLPGVRADLERRAAQVRSVAAPQFAAEDVPGEPVRVVADSYAGKNRVGATVIAIHPRALGIERDRRILGAAIDAARG